MFYRSRRRYFKRVFRANCNRRSQTTLPAALSFYFSCAGNHGRFFAISRLLEISSVVSRGKNVGSRTIDFPMLRCECATAVSRTTSGFISGFACRVTKSRSILVSTELVKYAFSAGLVDFRFELIKPTEM